jgi:hypothetical protein
MNWLEMGAAGQSADCSKTTNSTGKLGNFASGHHAQLAASDNTNTYHGAKIRAARNTKFACCVFCHIFGGIFVIV